MGYLGQGPKAGKVMDLNDLERNKYGKIKGSEDQKILTHLTVCWLP